MTESIYLQLSAYAGIAATGVLTLNYLFGMLLGVAYQRLPWYARVPARLKRLNVYNWHNRTAYVVLALVVVHPVLLLFDPATKFTWVNIIFPLHAPTQRLYVALGTLAMYAILLVIVTSQRAVRQRLSFRVWKNIHLISYATGLLFIVHGVVMDPQLKDRPVDLLDAEKLASEACLLVLGAAAFFRVRYEVRRRQATAYYPLRVARVVRQTPDAESVVLAVPEKLRARFRREAGQYLQLKLLVRGQEYERAYSLSGDADAVDVLQFTVKRVTDGVVSNHLLDEVRAGTELQVMPPAGTFFQLGPATDPHHYVFFAAGSGITPIYAIIRAVLRHQPVTRLNLVYANHDEASIIFAQELAQLQRDHAGRFAITHVLSAAPAGWPGLPGRLVPKTVAELLTQGTSSPAGATDYHVCGPAPFMAVVEEALAAHGVPAGRVHVERFVSIGAAGVPLTVGTAADGPPPAVATVRAQLQGVESEVRCAQDQTLLDALLATGLDVPYSCKTGICGSCQAHLVAGQVQLATQGVLTAAEIREQQVLTCQARPLSDGIMVVFDPAHA